MNSELAALTLAAAAALVVLPGCSQKSQPVAAETKPPAVTEPGSTKEVVLSQAAREMAEIKVAPVTSRPVSQRIETTARLALDENATWKLGSVTSGRVIYVYKNVGDAVKKGEVLARLHSHDIHESRAEYRKAKAELARQKAQREYAVRQRDRARRLLELKAGSQQQLESAEAELRNVETALQAAQIELQRSTQHLEDFLGVPAEDPHDVSPSAPEEEVDLVPVRAPADGVIIERSVTPGTVVDASAMMFSLSDLRHVWAILSVNEEYLSKLHTGLPATVYVQAFPNRPFRGRISWIGEELDPATRTVQVRVALDNRSGELKPEMYANAEIEVGGQSAALFVPQEAIQEVNGESVVFIRTAPDHFAVRAVQVGHPLEDLIEIRNGVAAGETVVTAGSFILKSQLLRSSLAEE